MCSGLIEWIFDYFRYLDECAMKAIAQLLSALPLQPEATDVDIMEAKSELFLK